MQLTIALLLALDAFGRAGSFPASGRDHRPVSVEVEAAMAEAEAEAEEEAASYCRSVIAAADTEDLLKDIYTDMEDAYDSDAYGHATYACAAHLVEDLAQYDKAEPYLWCVVSHCDNCTGSSDGSCMTSYLGLDAADECRSATLNFLGFVNRKKAAPDYDAAEEYYLEALELWPGNCGAAAYLAELYETTGATANVTLCDADAETSGARAAAAPPLALLLLLLPLAASLRRG